MVESREIESSEPVVICLTQKWSRDKTSRTLPADSQSVLVDTNKTVSGSTGVPRIKRHAVSHSSVQVGASLLYEPLGKAVQSHELDAPDRGGVGSTPIAADLLLPNGRMGQHAAHAHPTVNLTLTSDEVTFASSNNYVVLRWKIYSTFQMEVKVSRWEGQR